MIIDGKKIADEIHASVKETVSSLDKAPSLTVIACNPNFETQKYLALKKSKAEALGIRITVVVLPEESETQVVIDAVYKAASESDGIIVQLPLPKHIDTSTVLESVPDSHDVDAFNYQKGTALVLPPVVGAIDEISKNSKLTWAGKKVVIFGAGRLVGAPVEYYARTKDSDVTVLTEASGDTSEVVMAADIVVLGVGQANLLNPDMVKDGVVVFDAGASEDGGLLVGDANPEVAQKASLFTPVPGGIGPITIAILFRNLLELSSRQ